VPYRKRKKSSPRTLKWREALETYTDVVFISRNAVEIGMQMINHHGGMPKNMRVMAVGAETAKQLYSYKIDALFPEKGSGAEALLKVGPMKDLSRRRVLLVRGQSGLDWPAEEMAKRGAEVTQAKCYIQSTPKSCADRIKEVFDQNARIEGLFVHSSQSLKNLLAASGELADQLKRVKLLVGSKNIKRTAFELNWLGDVHVAASPSNKHMMIAFSSMR
jgi:uroporphyrinogen-III synthase